MSGVTRDPNKAPMPDPAPPCIMPEPIMPGPCPIVPEPMPPCIIMHMPESVFLRPIPPCIIPRPVSRSVSPCIIPGPIPSRMSCAVAAPTALIASPTAIADTQRKLLVVIVLLLLIGATGSPPLRSATKEPPSPLGSSLAAPCVLGERLQCFQVDRAAKDLATGHESRRPIDAECLRES